MTRRISITSMFAYCKFVTSKNKVDQQVLDEMYRLAIQKTRKSFLPPIIIKKEVFLEINQPE